jgi:phosphonate transport system permease protein
MSAAGPSQRANSSPSGGSAATQVASVGVHIWHRFTGGQRLARFVVYLVIVAAIVVSAQSVEIIPEFLADAPEQVADLFARMWPVDWAHYQGNVHAALMETIHIASLGTLLALILALPVGVLAAHNLVRFTPINLLAKLILVSSRSVNSLVWALLFVGIFGPGALAGTLAIAFRSIGFVGKLFGEALEEAQAGPIEALTAAGAPWMSRMTFGYWPQVRPAFWSIALFRWDINVRESAVLGLVGAGGIGMALDAALNLFQWDRVALILISIVVIVIVAEIVVTEVRKRVI